MEKDPDAMSCLDACHSVRDRIQVEGKGASVVRVLVTFHKHLLSTVLLF